MIHLPLPLAMAETSTASEVKEISLLLLGKTGHGKSATGNTILSWKAFDIAETFESKTKTSALHCSHRKDGTFIRVVDSPGVMDTKNQEESTISEIMQGMSFCPNGFNALLFVIKYGIRYTKEERECLYILKKYFGSNFLKDFGIVIMTEGDNFDINHEDDNQTFEEWLQGNESSEGSEPIDELLKECNNRCVLFYNMEDEEEYEEKRKKCVNQLFYLVKNMKNVYTNHEVDLAIKAREDLAKKLKMPVLHTPIQEKISLLVEQIKKDIKNNTFSDEDMKSKTNDLFKEVQILSTHYQEKSDILKLEKRLNAILNRLTLIKTKTRLEQRTEQMQMLKNLVDLKNPPTKFNLFINKVFCYFAYILKPVGTVLSFGFAREALAEFVKRREEAYEKMKNDFDQYEEKKDCIVS